MRLQALDKDLDWKKEVTAFLAIKVYTNTVEPVFDEPLYSVTSPLGYLYSRDTSIQGTQKIWSRKNVQIIFVFVMAVLKRHLSSNTGYLVTQYYYSPLFRERCTFSEYRKHGFNLYSGDTSAPKKRLTQKIVTTSISWSWFLTQYLAAWNNDCSRFQGGIIGKHFILLVLTYPIIPPWNLLQSLLKLLTNRSPTSIQVTLALVTRVSPE